MNKHTPQEDFERHYGPRGERMPVSQWDARIQVWQTCAAQAKEEKAGLLAALDELLQKCEAHFKQTGFPHSFHAGVYGSTLDKARAAISKAKEE